MKLDCNISTIIHCKSYKQQVAMQITVWF